MTTKIEDVEAGFSMEEGDFPLIPPDALGKAWPLAFGSVCDIQAVQVRRRDVALWPRAKASTTTRWSPASARLATSSAPTSHSANPNSHQR